MAEDSKNENGEKKTSGKPTDPCLLIDYVQELAQKSFDEYNSFGWSNFKTIDVDPKVTPASIISSMTSRGGLSEFLEMDNTTLGLLVPKVKLFKQYYESEMDTVGKSVEFLFDDSFDRDRINAITLSGLARSGGAGIKEVNWEFNGTNPAEAERVISVSMKLVFQSAYDLLGDRYDPAEGNILAIDPESDFLGDDGVKYTKNYIDLILHPPSKTDAFGGKAMEDEVGNKYVPKFYRLKMVVGWAVPEGNFPNLQDEPDREYISGQPPKPRGEKLKEELRAMELSIFLNLVSHQLDIRENGQIELSIDYVGSFEETINGNSANVLTLDKLVSEETSNQVAEDQNLAEQTRELQEGTKRRIQDLKNKIDCLDLSSEEGKEKAKILEASVKDYGEFLVGLNDDIEAFDDNSKSTIYQQFLLRINRKVKSFSLTEEQAKEWTDSLETSLRPKFEDLVNIKTADPAGAVATGFFDSFGAEDREGGVLNNVQSEAVDIRGDAADQESELNEAIDVAKKNLEDLEIKFLYLGDILDLACELSNTNYNKQMDSTMKILSGPIMITHPRQNGRKIHMNLADLPISYDEFQLFFFETVVRKELASYPLRSFIKDVLERLVKRVLQPRECFAKGREQREIDIGMTNFTVRSSVARQMRLQVTNHKIGGRFVLDPSVFNSLNPEPSDPDSDFNCMLLYMTSYASYDLKGDEGEDKSKGIYHYFIGAEKGLIQKIEFSRSDVQGLREARQAESRNLGQIRDVYNANVRMIGNTLYIPGMKVFLNPPIGFGRPEAGTKKPDEASGKQGMYGSLANLLGIGGYYDVIKVQSTISRGSVFSTELDCVFAQSGGESDKLKDLCSGVTTDAGLDAETKKETGS